MSVYVDPLCNHGWILRGKPTLSCHLFGIGPGARAELLRFARRIGLSEGWLQGDNRNPPFPHFDLVPRRRAEAVKAGAIELSREEAVNLWRNGPAEHEGKCNREYQLEARPLDPSSPSQSSPSGGKGEGK